MGSLKAPDVNNHRTVCRHDGGNATILGVGKAVPLHEFQQNSFSDYYFEISRSNHMVDLKAKFANICKSMHVQMIVLCKTTFIIVCNNIDDICWIWNLGKLRLILLLGNSSRQNLTINLW